MTPQDIISIHLSTVAQEKFLHDLRRGLEMAMPVNLHAQSGEPISAIPAPINVDSESRGVMSSDGDGRGRDGVGSENLPACTNLRSCDSGPRHADGNNCLRKNAEDGHMDSNSKDLAPFTPFEYAEID